jgi:hypothetical protein
LLIASAALCLAACQHHPARIETVTVKVPIPIACPKPEQIPARPAKPAMPADPVAALAVAMQWLLGYDAYATEADALLRACSQGS